jgi:ferritin
MLISKKMNAALNQQIGNEFGASLQYVAIACHFANDGLSALAGHFFKQADEEREHAMRFVKYILEAGGKVEIPAVPAPQCAFKNAAEAVKLSLDWELTVTRQINDLVNLAIKESDHLAHNMLNWFVKEQLEEVSSMDNLLKVVQRAGETNLLHVEQYLVRAQKKAAASEAEGEGD